MRFPARPARSRTLGAVPRVLLATLPWASGAEALGAAPRGAAPRGSYVVVARISGQWVVEGDAGEDTLRSALVTIPARATVRPVATPGGATPRLKLRDSTSAVDSVVCLPASRCAGGVRLDTLTFGAGRLRGEGPKLYHEFSALGRRPALRILGSRGGDGVLPLLVLARTDSAIDLAAAVAAATAAGTRGPLVVRLCALDASDADARACLTDRRPRPDDCALDGVCSAAGRVPGAFRVELFVRESTMLGAVPVLSGFAAVVVPARAAAAERARVDLTRLLDQAQEELSAEEYAGLLAAAAMRVAAAR